MLIIKSASLLLVVLPLVAGIGCSSSAVGDRSHVRVDAGLPAPDATAPALRTDAGAPADAKMPPMMPKPTVPLGVPCGSDSDCSSGFCADGVCCDSACGQTCYACNQQPTNGHCAPITSGHDPNATAPCVGASLCVVPTASGVPTCKLTSPLGTSCSANSDCTSGFCTDGVCCDSACDQTCYACNQPSATGHCAAITTGHDPAATSPCIGSSSCFLPAASTTVPACKLVDGTACQGDSDCIRGHCLTYYLDADGDGYGGSEQAHFCEELNAPPPAGYAAYFGDCCDVDSGANPGFSSNIFLQMPNACGSFDWNCDGVLTQEQTCTVIPGGVACGRGCYVTWGDVTSTDPSNLLFVEACH